MPKPKSAVVIGAGIAGLATAGLLAKEGLDVTVLEKGDWLGGRAGEYYLDGFCFETGPSWYLMPEAFDRFFELMGTTTNKELDLISLDPGYRVFPEGADFIDIPLGQKRVCALFDELSPGAGPQLQNYLASAQEIYEIALQRFLYTNFVSPAPFMGMVVLRRALRLMYLLCEPLDRFVEKQFLDLRLQQILQYPAVFLSTQPRSAPSLYHLMSHTDLTQGVRYPQGGFTSIVSALEKLAREYGARIELNAEVTEIIVKSKQARGVRYNHEGQQVNLAADMVVGACDIEHVESQLIPSQLRTYSPRYFAQRDPGVGAVLVLLGVRDPLGQLQHHNLFFSRDWDRDFTAVFPDKTFALRRDSQSMYVCKPSHTDNTVAPSGMENLFVLIPVAADPSIGHGDAYHEQASAEVAAIAERAIDFIAQRAEIPDLRDRIVVHKTIGPQDFQERYYSFCGGAIGPAHTLRQSAFLRGSNRSKKIANLYYAGGTTTPGVGVPLCLISAENILTRLRSEK
ncbi:phytoene dehydrogenase [Corynebacterium kutscheri]|uniref:Phytoene dehydrogenase n=1 Tax=Corynebacterium kutscheri TaxID=35755 RepID=A0A0F6TC43_9CORY|nr:phytoene desaturase family protein [Corynebacterium kutscheri]AKE40516.1 phytoene desaturase [Corynebacterium kutscheri]VEH05047.1 phytoene dehydrogenase [Corynebacterium kutscheri]VEH10911.1 phytoene dehydrogenase [Corynebacterium kutscheri]VEH80613.1 phytoene dehydrogenase [Corynebacterium kutscheri]